MDFKKGDLVTRRPKMKYQIDSNLFRPHDVVCEVVNTEFYASEMIIKIIDDRSVRKGQTIIAQKSNFKLHNKNLLSDIKRLAL